MNCRSEPNEVRDNAREQRADGVAEVAPESVDAEAGGAPRRMGMVCDRGQQGGIDHRRAESLEYSPEQPCRIGRDEDRQPDPPGLHDHASRDEVLTAEPIGSAPSSNQQYSP